FQSGRKERTQRSPARGPSAPPSDPRGDLRLARGLPSRPSTAPRVSTSLEGSEPTLGEANRLRLARGQRTNPRAGRIISVSLEATPRRKGQTALPLTRSSYRDIKCQPLL